METTAAASLASVLDYEVVRGALALACGKMVCSTGFLVKRSVAWVHLF